MKRFIYGIELDYKDAMILYDLCKMYLNPAERKIINIFFKNYKKIVNNNLKEIFIPYMHNLMIEKYQELFKDYICTNIPDSIILNRLKYIYNMYFLEYTMQDLYFILKQKKKTSKIFNESFQGLKLFNPITDYTDLYGKFILGMEINSNDIYYINNIEKLFIQRITEIYANNTFKPSIYICYC